mmetsp:Transcript_52606/g.161923  ORF Transcript_52606/g.161923 Transcript_52606/m.161923 type:complete len:288 (-) Transcript_52606:16-879(-)
MRGRHLAVRDVGRSVRVRRAGVGARLRAALDRHGAEALAEAAVRALAQVRAAGQRVLEERVARGNPVAELRGARRDEGAVVGQEDVLVQAQQRVHDAAGVGAEVDEVQPAAAGRGAVALRLLVGAHGENGVGDLVLAADGARGVQQHGDQAKKARGANGVGDLPDGNGDLGDGAVGLQRRCVVGAVGVGNPVLSIQERHPVGRELRRRAKVGHVGVALDCAPVANRLRGVRCAERGTAQLGGHAAGELGHHGVQRELRGLGGSARVLVGGHCVGVQRKVVAKKTEPQ